ncbi:MAG: hypothetical protein GX174_11170 [Lentisphaerae bacterium]|jgi:hypothetical protein|nr:hypothetical protein [Lentisphaerota bacterium]
MQTRLKTFHVMPLLRGREAELAADAERLLNDGVCTDVACMMTLVPEGQPAVNKAQILGERFTAFRDAFKGDRSRIGILAQATIGHGWTPDEPAAFQKITRTDGTPAYQMCPLDTDFQEYIRKAFLHLANLRPAFVMIDDDFRLLNGRNGCYCPLHLAEIGRRLNRTFTREALLDVLRQDESAAQVFDALLLDSLLQLAGVIRDAIDAIAPGIPGSFCTCYGDTRHANPIARRLAGAGQPRIVRINNARYLSPEMRSFQHRMYHGAVQIAGLDPDTIILAETDTCPQNRYSSGANLMHSHYTGSILEGCHGAKHWITRTRTYQPASGEAYREVLAKYHGFYETLFQSVQASQPVGYAAAVLPTRPPFNPPPERFGACGSARTWGSVLGVMGLPCNFARMPDLPALLTGEDLEQFPDDDVRRLLANGLLLDGGAAEKLCRRGFGAALGVRAGPWDGPAVSGELWGDAFLGSTGHYTRLVPEHPQTRIHSMLVHRQSGVSEALTEIGPAVTLFKNAQGARVAIYAAGLGSQQNLTTFGFYDEDRKRQLVELLGWVCGQPVDFYYPGDAEVYLKLRRFGDGRYLLALFNLGHDPLDTIPLASAYRISAAHMITPSGTWRKVALADGALQTTLLPAQPKVFRLAVAGAAMPA